MSSVSFPFLRRLGLLFVEHIARFYPQTPPLNTSQNTCHLSIALWLEDNGWIDAFNSYSKPEMYWRPGLEMC